MKTERKTADPDCTERLRHALSYREKAVQEARAARDEQARFAAASHAREAERLLLGIRDELSRDAAALGRQLQENLARQKSLHTEAASGAVSARKANRLNRRFVARIEHLRGRIEQVNRWLNASSSEEIGGFEDMPLAAYVHAIRRKPPRPSVKPSLAGFVVWIGLVALAVLGSLYYLDYFKSVPPVVMEVTEDAGDAGAIRVMCRNDSDGPILLYVPWQDPVSAEVSGLRGSKGYGVAVYVRERDSREFRLFPVSVSSWTYQGRTIQESTPIEVAPHLYVNLVLDKTTALAGTDPQAVRIALLNASGKTVTEHKIDLRR